MKFPFGKDAEHPYLLAIVTLGVTVFLSKLWQGDMRGDSLFYAEVAKEILKTGDWLTMHFAYKPYFNKPPLLFWLTALNYKLFGVNCFSARLWSPLIALVSGIALYFLTSRIFDRKTAFLAAIILFMTRDFIKDNMGLRMDSTVVLSLILFLLLLEKDFSLKYALGAGVALGIGLLAKSYAGLYGPLIFAVWNLIRGRGKRIISPSFIVAVAVGLGLFSLWLIPVYVINGKPFFDAFIGKETLSTLAGLNPYSKGKIYYIKVLLKTYWPWLLLLPVAIYRLCKDAPLEAKSLLLSWVGVVTFSLLFPKPEYGRYMMPLYPAFAMAVGFFISHFLDEIKTVKLAKAITLGSILTFFVLNVFPVRLHRISYEALRELKPLIDYRRAKGEKIYVFRPHPRTFQAVIYYLDFVPSISSDPETIPSGVTVIAEGKHRELLRGRCEERLFNGSYAVFECR